MARETSMLHLIDTIAALSTAIQEEYEEFGFKGFLAELEVCKDELSKVLANMRARLTFPENSK